MNSRFVDVKERRLKTIYDALDAANNKKAIQESEKVLRKDPRCQTAKALKGLALFRSNRASEASALLSDLAQEEPSDEACLQAMTYYYREAGCHESICDIYETANKKKPNNEDIMTTLFMSHVRLMNYQRQQQIARDLHKIMPAKMPYFFWSVMSLFMQAKSAKNNLGAKMFLPLAEKMIAKVMKEGKLKAEAEYELYLMILEEQDKWADALDFLTASPLIDTVLKDQCVLVRYELNYRRKLEEDHLLHMKCRDLVKEDPDDWALYKEYLERGIKVVDNNADSVSAVNDGDASKEEVSLEGMATFLETMRSEHAEIRGPYLARLIYIELLSAPKHQAMLEQLGDPLEHMVDYFRLFGGKPVCPLDLLHFIDKLIGPERQREFIGKLEEVYNEANASTDSSDMPANLNTMFMQLAIESLRRRFGHLQKCSDEERQSKIAKLLEIYQHSLSFGSDLERTEIQPADGFLQLAVLLHTDAWLEEARAAPEAVCAAQVHLWRAVILLEKALEASPSNHHLKICLLKVYCFLGAYQPALVTFQNLEIKHVQYDSLGYLICQPGLHLASFSSALGVWNNIVKFFSLNRKDMMEYVVSAYRSGSFRKVPEFIDFNQRLSDSFQFNWCKVELRLQTILSSSSKFEELLQTFSDMAFDVESDEINFDGLVDGRDFDVTLTFEPKDRDFTREDQEASFTEEKRWVRLRNITCQMFALSCKFVMDASKHVMALAEVKGNESMKNGDISDASSKLHERATSLLKQMDEMKANTSKKEYVIHNGNLKSAYASFTSLYFHGCFTETLKKGLNFISYINRLSQNPSVQDAKFEASLPDLFLTDLKQEMEKLKSAYDRLPMSEFLARLVCLAESISLSTIFVMSAQSLYRPFRKSRSKRKKKGPPSIDDCPFAQSMATVDTAMQALCDLAASLGQHVTHLQESLDSLPLLDKGLANMDTASLDSESIRQKSETIRDNVRQSYCASLNELRRMMEYVSGRSRVVANM